MIARKTVNAIAHGQRASYGPKNRSPLK